MDQEIFVNDPSRVYKDESGQWWYRFGQKRPGRLRATVQICEFCKRPFVGAPMKRGDHKPTRHCTRTCGVRASYAKQEHPMAWKGENSRSWKGGRRETPRGYILINMPGHHSLQGSQRRYVLEHRLVMEQYLGRNLESYEQVHHKNGIRNDNRIENLELWALQQPSGQRINEQQHCPTCTCHK